ncbi:histidine phosphatase family protein [Paenarthrobacter sp. Z7-10]|nr:histidine phosphatase family protein [Paenarthrobacter sp. Z7-10]
MAGPPVGRRRIIFWRHGRTSWNAAGRFQGQTDIDLDDTGRAQADKSAALLAAVGPTRILSSDLARARDTATALANLTGLQVDTDQRLRETFAGSWEGLTFEEIGQRYPGDMLRWRQDDALVRAGGGETRVEVGERMRAAVLDSLSTLPSDGTLVLATHGGSARVGIARLLGLPYQNWQALSGLANCNWSVVEELAFEETAPGQLIHAVGVEVTDIGAGDVGRPADAAAATQIRWKLTEHNAGTLPEPATVQEG